LVDELRLFLAPIVVGGREDMLPADVRVGLALMQERRIGGGMIPLRCRTSA
jgi:hypothetical protein